MKRKNKNILMLSILILLIGGIVFIMANMNNNDLPNTMEPPDMNNIGPPIMSNDNEKMEEPPAKLDGDINIGDMDIPAENNDTPPARPDDNNIPPDIPNDDNFNRNIPNNMNEFNNKSNTIYYVLLTVLNLFASLIIIHLVMSKFNNKTFKETYSSTDKIMILILLTILLTGFTISSLLYINNHYLINNNVQLSI